MLMIRSTKAYNKLNLLVFLLLSILTLHKSYSQEIELRGTVKDSLKTPLNYANVVVKPTNKNKSLQYTVTDEKGLYRLYFQKGDTVIITVSYLGYIPINFEFIANKSTTKHFIMKTSPEQLDEIIIEMPVTVKGDTTTYRTDKFVTGEERKLKNVLKKLPGVEVDKNGNITVQGKKITKMLVDGKKFFGGNSKLAVDNIPADAVDKVQVIDNYNEVAFLKDLTDSDELAMNIELKEEKKKFTFGDVEVGKGNNEFYKAHANIFYYSPKTNLNFIGNLNNIAEKTLTFKDYLSFQGGVNAVFNGNFKWVDGDLFQFIENRDVLKSQQKFGAINVTKTASDKVDISGYLILNQLNDDNFLETQNDYSTFNEFRENSTQSNIFFGIGKINMEYKPSNSETWYLRTQVRRTENGLDNLISSSIGNQTNDILTNRNTENVNLNQNIEWHKRKSEKQTLSSIINYSFTKDNRFSFWETDDDILQGLIPIEDNQDVLRLLQDKDQEKHNLDVVFKHFWEINNNNHIYTTIGNKYLIKSFKTNDRQELDNGSINDFSSSDFGNDLNFKLNDLFLGLHYKFRTGIFTVKQGFHLRNLSWDVDQQNNFKRSKWFVLPDFLAKIDFNKSRKIEVNYSLRTSFTDASKLASKLYLRSYNSVFRGNEQLENNLFHSARIYYSRFSLYRGLMMNGSVSYSKQIRGVNNTVEFDGINQFLIPRLFNDPSENFNVRGFISKKIKKVRYKLEGDFSSSRYLQEIDNVTQFNKDNNYSFDLGIETIFDDFPNLDIGFKRTIGEFTSSNNTSKFTTNEPYIKIDYDFLDGFIFSFDYSLYDFENKALNQQNRFDVANFTLSYQKENSGWTYKIFSNNLFNTRFKRNSTFNQYLISDTKTFILPRVLMFSIGYNL